MTAHLTPEDLIAVVDGGWTPERRTHLDSCASCRASLEDLRQVLGVMVEDRDLPEPSPLFWDHLSARVLEATRERQPSAREMWWCRVWKPVAAACAAATLLWAVGVSPWRSPVPPVVTSDTAADAVGANWDEVIAGVDALSVDDLSEVASIGLDAPVLVDELTPAEREAFAVLLERELRRLP